MSIENYFNSNSEDPDFIFVMKKLARQFARCHKDYLEYCLDSESEEHTDIGWFYNERPNIGFLAAAAWRTKGWIAIEEYRFDKVSAEKADLSKGRADLYIGARLNDGSRPCFAIEAKQAFVGGKKSTSSALKLDNSSSCLSRAVADAKQMKHVDAEYVCGVGFICPEVSMTKSPLDRFEEISEAFWGGCDLIGREYAAFSFVPANLKHKGLRSKAKHTLHYPAIAAVVVPVRRPKQK